MAINEIQRHRSIIDLIQSNQAISIKDIVDQFEVSPATARRDLYKLAEQKLLKRIRGGAEAINRSDVDLPLSGCRKTVGFTSGKKAIELKIAQKAISLLTGNDSVTIASKATATLLADAICHTSHPVTTNFYPLAQYLIDKKHCSVFVPGGQFLKESSVFVHPADLATNIFCTDRMFLWANGITNKGIYSSDIVAGISERQLASVTNKITVIVDNNCLPQVTGSLIARLNLVDSAIITPTTSPDVLQLLKDSGIHTYCV